jgi:hypothetical protein
VLKQDGVGVMPSGTALARLYARAHYQNWNVFGGNQVAVNGNTTPYTTTNYTFGYTHTLTNVGKSPAKFVTVEFK